MPHRKHQPSLPWRIAARFVRGVDTLNTWVGKFAMWLFVLMLAVLVWGIVSQAIYVRSSWVVEMAQFTMASYYLLGAGWVMQQGGHVRMDVFYARWRPRTRSAVDSLTSVFLIFYLVLLIVGGWESTAYALETGQRSRSLWRPYMAPIKIIMTTAMALMLLQALAELCRDLARALGRPLPARAGTTDEAEPVASR
jgi:TRAP-type mannitol/chloroaromatic compound transport system permease small subunit